MLTQEELLEVMKWETVEDIFASSIDIVAHYKDIIDSYYLDRDLYEPFILAIMNNGNEAIVVENIDIIDLNMSWRIAKENPDYKKIFLENFDKAVENETRVDDVFLKEISRENKSLIIDNWEALVKRTEDRELGRIELISILSTTEKGRNVIDTQLPTLVYGDFSYGYLINDVLKDGQVSQEKIANLILDEPSKMIEQNLCRVVPRI